MKKIGLLALAIVLALGTMGAGFAYWNETLTIEDPMNTGELEVGWVTATSGGATASPPEWMYEAGTYGKYHWGEASVSEDGNTLSVGLHKMYPSAVVATWPRIYNNGSIPVKITGYTVKMTGGSDALWNALQVQYYMVHHYSGGSNRVYTSNYMSISDWEDDLNSHATAYQLFPPGPYGTGYIVLAPGDYLSFDDEASDEHTLKFHIKSDADNDIEGTDVEFTVGVAFTQFNATP